MKAHTERPEPGTSISGGIGAYVGVALLGMFFTGFVVATFARRLVPFSAGVFWLVAVATTVMLVVVLTRLLRRVLLALHLVAIFGVIGLSFFGLCLSLQSYAGSFAGQLPHRIPFHAKAIIAVATPANTLLRDLAAAALGFPMKDEMAKAEAFYSAQIHPVALPGKPTNVMFSTAWDLVAFEADRTVKVHRARTLDHAASIPCVEPSLISFMRTTVSLVLACTERGSRALLAVDLLTGRVARAPVPAGCQGCVLSHEGTDSLAVLEGDTVSFLHVPTLAKDAIVKLDGAATMGSAKAPCALVGRRIFHVDRGGLAVSAGDPATSRHLVDTVFEPNRLTSSADGRYLAALGTTDGLLRKHPDAVVIDSESGALVWQPSDTKMVSFLGNTDLALAQEDMSWGYRLWLRDLRTNQQQHWDFLTATGIDQATALAWGGLLLTTDRFSKLPHDYYLLELAAVPGLGPTVKDALAHAPAERGPRRL